jgi:hypothetical protein
MASMTKQPSEILPVDIVFSTFIAGRTTTLISPVVTVPTGMTKVSEQLSGETLQLYVGGGTTGTTYRWVVTTEVTIGGKISKIEDEFDVVILEI